jgi:hypothetical protein
MYLSCALFVTLFDIDNNDYYYFDYDLFWNGLVIAANKEEIMTYCIFQPGRDLKLFLT